MRTTRNPVLLDHDGPAIDRHAPTLGEHSEEVLRELGYAPDAIAELVATGATKTATLAHEASARHARA
jgi:crotonobetainyl-CoA:carnitine CoA-transferase CaiB-like acyl-CoA transferase